MTFTDPTGLEDIPFNTKKTGGTESEFGEALRRFEFGVSSIDRSTRDWSNKADARAIKNNDLPRSDDGSISSQTPFAESNESDAYRHFNWSADLTLQFGIAGSKIIGDNHELYGREGYGGTNGSKMDLWNNSIGRQLAARYKNNFLTTEELFEAAEKLELLVISPDSEKVKLMEDKNSFKDGEVIINETRYKELDKLLGEPKEYVNNPFNSDNDFINAEDFTTNQDEENKVEFILKEKE